MLSALRKMEVAEQEEGGTEGLRGDVDLPPNKENVLDAMLKNAYASPPQVDSRLYNVLPERAERAQSDIDAVREVQG